MAVSSRLCKRKKLAVEIVKERGESVVGEKLIANERPVSNGSLCPLFLQLKDAKIKQFENRIIVRKRAAFSDLAKTGINSLNGVGRIHNLANCRGVIKKLLDVSKTAFPDGNRTRMFTPDLAETLKLDAAGSVKWIV